MKNNKGFTLIEILAVILLIGIVAVIAIPAVSKYLGSSKNTTYTTYEKSMVDAAKNRIINCISNNEQCELPDNDAEQKIFLDLLIEEGYLDNMKDPDSHDFCNELISYVSIKEDGHEDYNYAACLYCGSYYTENDSCKKIVGDGDNPICGTINGESTRWTKENRTISVGCSDVTSGCESTTFSKTFNRTTKIGHITIRDKKGTAVNCSVNAYVDKNAPTCSVDVTSDNYLESVGWYSNNVTANLSNMKDGTPDNAGNPTESGLLTYGMGTSIKSRDYNKKTSLFINNSGITTIIGYTKDIAGNEGMCGREVKIGTGIPKFNLYYGYQIFPTDDEYTASGMQINGSNITTTSDNPTINYTNMTKYKNTKKIIISLNSPVESSTIATVTLDNLEIYGTMSQGSSEIVFLVPNSRNIFENLTIKFGELSNKTYSINRIELLTESGETWSNKDIKLYIEPKDEGLRTIEYSYDNGTTWTTANTRMFTEYSEITILTRNAILMNSNPTHAKIRIDKEIPVATILATKANTENEVESNEWLNSGLDFKISYLELGPVDKTLYYCKDTVNNCEPNIEIERNELLTLFRDVREDYYLRYKVVNVSGVDSGSSSFIAKYDLEKPVCVYNDLTSVDITRQATLKLTCTDTKSGLVSKTVTANDFVVSNSNMSIQSVTQKAVTGGIEISIVLRGDAKGDSTIEFKANTLSDKLSNSNNSASKTLRTNGVFNITLNSQGANNAGTTNIYEDYAVGWYSNSNISNQITTITIPTKNGYVFGGYYTETNGGGTLIINSSGSISGSASTYTSTGTIYAKWNDCGNGSYCVNGVKTSCPAGTYGNGKTTESTQAGACTTCEKGYYCAGGTSRVGCGAGKYNDLTGQSAATACKNISAGCYGTSGTTSCPNSCTGRLKYSGAGSSSCNTVSSGYYTTGCNGSGNNCTGQSQCTAGNYCSNGVSSGCGGGKYSSSAGATGCSNITAGCYGTSASTACPNACAGRTKYSGAGASSCSTVSSGYYTTGCNGSGNNCTGQSQCTAGNYCSNGISYACGGGKYSGAGATGCTNITAGCYGTSASAACPNACSGRTKYSGAGSSSCSTVSSGYYTTGCDGSGNKCTGQSQCTAGNYCVNGVSNKCATYYTSAAGATSCYDNTTPTIYDYTSTNVKDTLTNMTICNFGSDTGSGLKQVEYYFSCNTTHKTATISGGCATITPSSPCSGAVFYYRIRDDRNWTGWKSVSNFGAYFLLAREYNKLLMYNPAYNSSDNITFHINRLNGNLAGRLTEVGTTAISKSTSVSNEEIVKRMYRGILGREPAASEVAGHVNGLKNGKTREQVLSDFINSNEAKNIRSSWGY